MDFVKFSRICFLQTTSDGAVSENLRDVFVQQVFSLYLKLCFRLIYFHSYSFAANIAKMSLDIFFSNVSLKDTSYRKKCLMKTLSWNSEKLSSRPEVSCNFIEKRLQYRGFSVNFAKLSRTSLLQKTTARLLLEMTQNNLQYFGENLLKYFNSTYILAISSAKSQCFTQSDCFLAG